MNRQKAPLYRKHNKLARSFDRKSPGGAFRHQRNTKKIKGFEGDHMAIPHTREGYDYTPLFRFLLSRAGQNWDNVHSEAIHRLDKHEPIFWLVDIQYTQGDPAIVRLGESTYYSKLTVKDGLLQIADPNAMAPPKSCTCCTHTFNGVAY